MMKTPESFDRLAICANLGASSDGATRFKLSTDPDFEEKLVDVVGLYVNPPAAAAMFCFHEKTQAQEQHKG